MTRTTQERRRGGGGQDPRWVALGGAKGKFGEGGTGGCKAFLSWSATWRGARCWKKQGDRQTGRRGKGKEKKDRYLQVNSPLGGQCGNTCSKTIMD